MTDKPSIAITGGASGIGKAIAHILTPDYRIAILDTKQCYSITGADILSMTGSVSNQDDVSRFFKEVLMEFGRLDALVTCAGVGFSQPIVVVVVSDWARVIDVNLTGTFLCCREALRYMIPSGQGRIVTLGSLASMRGFPGQSAYSASKWGIRGLTEVLANEVRKDGIQVSCVHPGTVNTEIWDQIMPDAPRGKMLTTEEIADIVAFVIRQPKNVTIESIVVMPASGEF